MIFLKKEQWIGLPFPSPGDLPNPGIDPGLHIAGRFFTIGATKEAYFQSFCNIIVLFIMFNLPEFPAETLDYCISLPGLW